MAMKYLRVLLLMLVGALLLQPPDLNSCGPFIPEAQFAWLHGPVGDGKAFARGELGVLRPHFYRKSLVFAYRQLAGVPLDPAEIAALFPASPQDTSEGATRWIAARSKVPGVKPITSIDVNRQNKEPDSYGSYVNCLDDAFDNAIATLQRHLAQWRPDGVDLQQWIQAQDQVFENCSGGPSIPAATPQSADPAVAAARQYQIASAEFYAGQFAEAERDFGKVAANTASRWRDAAPYLIARTLVREGTVTAKAQALEDAQRKLQLILKDPKLNKSHAAAQGLLNFVRGRLYPKERMAELGAELLRPHLEAKIDRTLTDYEFLWDKATEQSQEKGDVPRQDELTDWIATFQGADGPHAIERWRKQHTTPWLIASLVAIARDNAAAPELISEARKIRQDSPAYATAVYYGIKLQMERGENDAARSWVDEAAVAKQPAAAHNMFLAERMKLARDWAEFLRYSPRRPVAQSVDLFDEPLEKGQAAAQLDSDAAGALNGAVPLARWLDAAKNDLLPRPLQADIAQAGWVRAVLLDKNEDAHVLARRLVESKPKLATTFKAYLAEADPSAAKFTALFLMLQMPGFQPIMRAGFGRMTNAPGEMDSFRDNWWDLGAAAQTAAGPEARLHEPLLDLYPKGRFGPTQFLPAAELKQGEAEWSSLVKTAAIGPNYLCSETVRWARAHPQDPRVPEALHLSVHATRYGPTDDNTGKYSKEAFDLLHAKYPNSKWAKETKYWFK
jgi:hypothetical protein